MTTAFLRFRQAFLGVALVGALAFATGACSIQDTQNSRTPRRENADVRGLLDRKVESFMQRYRAVVKGELGTSDTSAYLRIPTPRLGDRPYGPEDGNILTSHAEFASAPHPTEMPALSRVIVRGRVVAIGLPHFNSTDGSFWAPELNTDPEAPDVARTIFRDVLFQVNEVWGSLLPDLVSGSLVRFVVRGGQIAVDLPEQVAEQLEFGSGGVYIFAEESPVDMVVGEHAVIFLDVRPILGLFNAKMSAHFDLFPAHESGFKYIHKDSDTIGLPTESEFDISVATLLPVIEQELGRNIDYRNVEVGTTLPLGPHPPGEGERVPIIGASP